MQIAFVEIDDIVGTEKLGESPFGRAPARVASPALLARAAVAEAAGDAVSYHHLGASEIGAALPSLGAPERVVVKCAGGIAAGGRAAALVAALGERAVEVFDPWAAPPASTLPAYGLAKELALAEADTIPPVEPVHPWVCPARAGGTPADAEARLGRAAAALAHAREAQLCLNDERVRIDMPRLRQLAELVRASLRDSRTILDLHLRAWPEDLLAERVLDHLALLPIASLDLLVGSLRRESLARMGSPLAPAELERVAAEVLRGGLGHLSRLSIVLGLPGESADDCVAMVNDVFRVALTHRIPRLRFSMWRGDLLPATDETVQEQRFMATHPEWHPVEYRGVHDYVAVTAMAHPQLSVVGP
jgi:hypothetical protein